MSYDTIDVDADGSVSPETVATLSLGGDTDGDLAESNLLDGATTIYDSTNGYVPAGIVQILSLGGDTDGDLAGTNLSDGATTIWDTAAQKVPKESVEVREHVSYEPGHTEWADALADEEIKRIVPPTGATVHIDTLAFQQKGGGTSTSASVDIYDVGAATELASVTLGSADRTGYSAGAGNTVLVRVANATGAAISAEPIVRGRIV